MFLCLLGEESCLSESECAAKAGKGIHIYICPKYIFSKPKQLFSKQRLRAHRRPTEEIQFTGKTRLEGELLLHSHSHTKLSPHQQRCQYYQQINVKPSLHQISNLPIFLIFNSLPYISLELKLNFIPFFFTTSSPISIPFLQVLLPFHLWTIFQSFWGRRHSDKAIVADSEQYNVPSKQMWRGRSLTARLSAPS